jgi:hypothetical protein
MPATSGILLYCFSLLDAYYLLDIVIGTLHKLLYYSAPKATYVERIINK